MASSVKIQFNHFPQLAKALHEVAVEIVAEIAEHVKDSAQDRAPVETGFFQAAYYTVTQDHDGEGAAEAAAKAHNAKGEWVGGHDGLDNDTTALVVNGAGYSLPLEYGSAHGAAQPSLTPAMTGAMSAFERALGQLEKRLQEKVR